MAVVLQVDHNGNVTVLGALVPGSLTLPDSSVTNAKVSSTAEIARSKLAQESLVAFPIKLSDFRVWDAPATVLSGTSASDDLAYQGGTFGTNPQKITTGNIAGTSVTRYARVEFAVPAEYDVGQDLQIRISAGTISGTCDVSCTVDVECYESNKFTGVSSDLCSTAAQSMNSTTAANLDFVITAASLVPGDILDMRITIAANDTGGAGSCEAAIGYVACLCDIRA